MSRKRNSADSRESATIDERVLPTELSRVIMEDIVMEHQPAPPADSRESAHTYTERDIRDAETTMDNNVGAFYGQDRVAALKEVDYLYGGSIGRYAEAMATVLMDLDRKGGAQIEKSRRLQEDVTLAYTVLLTDLKETLLDESPLDVPSDGSDADAYREMETMQGDPTEE